MNKYDEELKKTREDAWDAAWSTGTAIAADAAASATSVTSAAMGAINTAWAASVRHEELEAQIKMTLNLLEE